MQKMKRKKGINGFREEEKRMGKEETLKMQ